jgi:hypothetical protein
MAQKLVCILDLSGGGLVATAVEKFTLFELAASDALIADLESGASALHVPGADPATGQILDLKENTSIPFNLPFGISGAETTQGELSLSAVPA